MCLPCTQQQCTLRDDCQWNTYFCGAACSAGTCSNCASQSACSSHSNCHWHDTYNVCFEGCSSSQCSMCSTDDCAAHAACRWNSQRAHCEAACTEGSCQTCDMRECDSLSSCAWNALLSACFKATTTAPTKQGETLSPSMVTFSPATISPSRAPTAALICEDGRPVHPDTRCCTSTGGCPKDCLYSVISNDVCACHLCSGTELVFDISCQYFVGCFCILLTGVPLTI